MKHDKRILVWSYLIELVLVSVVYGWMVVGMGKERLVAVIQDNWGMFSTTAAAFFAAGVCALFYFSQILESDFGKYLHWRKADAQYMSVYKMQALLFFFACIVPMAAMFGKSAVAGHTAWIISLYAGANVLTVVQNTVGLVRLRQKFRSQHDLIVAEMQKERSER